MTIDALTPEQRMEMYEQFNSPVQNAGVQYVTNPSVNTSQTTVNYLDALGALSTPLTAMIPSTPVEDTPKADLSDPSVRAGFDQMQDNPFDLEGITKPKKQLNIPYKNNSSMAGAKKAYSYYVNKHGLPAHVAAGIVGNLYRESGLSTKIEEQGGTRNGRGIAQWDRRDRWPALLKWAKDQGRDPYELTTQLDYVLVEPGEGDRALKKLLNTKDVKEATMVFGRTYERPKESAAAWDLRTSVAQALLNS